jgi:hypothetical protein
VAFEIGDHQIVGRHHAFADPCRRSEDVLRIQTEGNISISGSNVTTIVNPPADGANIPAVLVFRL